ncbi:MAG: hypothetical protein QOG09_682 [Solirubrobacterales bacterium]|nr:hypothetical protein [Solirubrobacterales bacterium]
MSRIGEAFDDLSYPFRRAASGAGDAIADLWFDRSYSFRRRTAAVAALVALYLVLKLLVMPLLPCTVPGADACPPSDDAARIVPGNALLYAHIDLDRGSGQFKTARKLAQKLPHAQALIQSAVGNVRTPSGGQIDLTRDVQSWAGDEAALIRLPGPGAGEQALLVAARDTGKALSFADRVGPGKARASSYKGQPLRLYDGGFTASLSRGFLITGSIGAVRSVIATEGRPASSLATTALPKQLRGALPEDRFADVYLSRPGIKATLAGRGGYASQLDTFSDFSASSGIAASARMHGDGVELQLESSLNPKLTKRHPPFFRAFAPFTATLPSELSDKALLYLGFTSPARTVSALLGQAAKAAPSVVTAYRALRAQVAARTKLDLGRQLLPVLKGETAIAAEPAARVPYATMLVKGVDEGPAAAAVARLVGPIVKASRKRGNVGAGLSVGQTAGVKTVSVRLSPSVNLTFSVFDGKLVLATDPAGVEQVRGSGASLAGDGAYKKAISRVGGKRSALVFVNLAELIKLGEERAGLAEDPTFATFAQDINMLRALGVGVSSDPHRLSTKAFLNIE